MDLQFVHLRIHSEYSLIDGLIKIKPLMEEAVKQKLPAIALTDQSNLFATVKFYQAALNSGIKPIIGIDIYLENTKDPKKPYCITLLCQNQIGYKNLLILTSESYTNDRKDEKAIVSKKLLAKYAAGLIVLSGGIDGDVGNALLENDLDLADDLLKYWLQIFPQRYYLELQRTGKPNEERYIQSALILAEKWQLPVIATNNVRFISKEDFEAHEARVCINQSNILADPRRPRIYTDQQYLRTQKEMVALFKDIPESLINTVELAKRCNLTLTLGKNFLPKYPVPVGLTTETYLIQEAKAGLESRLKILFNAEELKTKRVAYDERLELELNVIIKMGFAGYFLIVADFTRWARNNNVPVGPGRGSGPGSLVAYSLNITDLDPLAHDLLFERFLNPERVSMPDFDIDFCMEGRDRVIDYVMATHGRESVSQIITYGTMAAKAVIRDVGRVLGMPYGFVDKIAKLIPFELGMTLEKALAQEEILRTRYFKEDEVRTLIDLALKLEGITRNVGKHAGGVVIAPEKLTDFTPLYCEIGGEDHLVTQFDKDDVEAVGLVKFDFLGLRTLTTIDWAIKDINSARKLSNEEPINIHLLPMNDVKTFQILKACKTTAIFQLESRGMKDLVKRLQPDCFDDIVALVALFRPGPLQSGMVDDYINRKHKRAKVSYLHPKLESILRSTYGVILYQEQVMQIAQVLAGFTLGAADLLRRAMGKKKADEMAFQREIFCKGAILRGVTQEVASHIFDLMEKFAGYGFNKSHSASYALISYQTAWLKAHYPAAYMASVLSSDMDNTDKVVLFVEECKNLKLTITPPDINQSEYFFKVLNEKNIIYGLGAIKGAGRSAIEAIVGERNANGPFTNLFNFCERVGLRKLNRRVLEALIKAGAFDKIGPHRASILASIDLSLQHAEQCTRNAIHGQHDLFGITDSKNNSLKYIDVTQWNDFERLLREKETLGLYFSGHPITNYSQELSKFITAPLAELKPAKNKLTILAGIITQIRSLQTKKGDRMAVVTIEDANSQIDVLCFSDVYQKNYELLSKDKLIIIEGEVSIDEFNDSNRVLAREIFTIEKARERFGKYLQISIYNQQQEMTELAPLLEKHSGKCRILIDYRSNDAKANLRLGDKWRVNPTDKLLDDLRNLIKENKIEMVY